VGHEGADWGGGGAAANTWDNCVLGVRFTTSVITLLPVKRWPTPNTTPFYLQDRLISFVACEHVNSAFEWRKEFVAVYEYNVSAQCTGRGVIFCWGAKHKLQLGLGLAYVVSIARLGNCGWCIEANAPVVKWRDEDLW
jgi:hypothetical protein